MKVANYISKIDIFSVPFSPAIDDNEQFYHKSALGGLLSLIVILLSMIYGGFKLLSWTELQFLPKVTQQFQVFTQEEILTSNTISVNIVNTGYNEDGSPTVDPFNPEAIVIMPLLAQDIQDYYTLDSWTKYYKDGELIMNLTLFNETQPIITFIYCDPQYLEEGQACASEEVVAKFFSQIGNQLYLKMQFSIINPNNFETQIVQRTYSILLERSYCHQEVVYMQLTKYDLDKGSLLTTREIQYHYTDSTVQSQVSSADYCSRLFLPGTLGVFWTLQKSQLRFERMVYPKIGEVLAEIGSIISVLFMIKYLIVELNLFNLKTGFLDILISIYFPDMLKFEIKKNWLSKIVSVKKNGKSVDVKKFEKMINKLRRTFACKLNYMNLIYEVSRLQFIIQQMQDRAVLRASHQIGVRLDPTLLEDPGLKRQNRLASGSMDIVSARSNGADDHVIQDYKLKINDALVLTLQMREYYLKDEVVEMQVPNFYVINSIRSSE